MSRVCALLLAVASAMPAALEAQMPVFASERGPYRVTTVVGALQDPWSIAFLPDGDMLVTERPGRLRRVRQGRVQTDPIAGVPEVRYGGQGGLLDVALHPDFESNRLVYLSYSKPNTDGSEGTTAVVRGRLEDDRLAGVEEIFEAKAWSAGESHYGSRLVFDSEGYLFITVSDRAVDPLSVPRHEHPAQDLSNHQGTIVRLHDDGRVPSDNPFVGRAGALPEIWSYGHRSLQGLSYDSDTGELWATEHGAQGGDELNRILPGRNYGWPVVGYGVQYGGEPIHASRHGDGMEEPVQFWTPSIAPSGLMIYGGDRFPEWKGNAFVGGLSGFQVARVPLVETEEGYQVGRMERPPLMLGFGRVRDIREGPDGYIYIALDDRQGGSMTPIVRLEPAGGV
ncbi:MAG TPA: PQQ-dependent sugar dehydrogenase [Longimicrobiales bacterium]|nr:PQQ-dependent sugar dehydrogenase [Longimicrobiales bacterium]